MSRKGSSLAGAVCVIAVALLAVLTVGTSASANVQMVLRSENAQTASLLADSAIQQALAELMKDPTWGTAQASTKIEYAGPVENSDVRLTFNRTAGVPYCTRNDVDNFQPAWPLSKLLRDGKVPGKRVHLVAVAHCKNVTRTREAVVYVPNFTLSLGASGKVHLIDSMVGALDSADGIDVQAIIADPSKLKPGDLGTNSSDSQAALLENGSRVAGNLQAQGGITVLDTSVVGGEVRRFNQATELPHFDFELYDPKRDSVLNYNSLPAGVVGDQNLTGIVRCDGPSVTVNGDLNLDNCLLYVDGNLRVTGSVRGSGAVIVTGSATVQGGSGLTSADSVALLTRGDLSLVSSNTSKYMFQGLVYTRGNFRARNFTVVGGFVADGLTPAQGNIDMEGCLAIRVPFKTKVDMYFPLQLNLQFPSTIDPLAVDPNSKIDIPGEGPDISFGKNPALNSYQNGVWRDRNGDPLEDEEEIPHNTNGVPASGPHEMDDPGEGANIRPPGGGGAHNSWRWWQPVVLQINRETVNGQQQYVYYLIYEDPGLIIRRFTSREDLITATDLLGWEKCRAYYDGVGPDPDSRDYHKEWYRQVLPQWEERNTYTTGDNRIATFSFDPNRFLKESDKLRLSAWMEY